VGLKKAFMNKTIFALMIFLLTGCMSPKAPITCFEISNNYSKYDSSEVVLSSTKGYKYLSEYVFKYDSIYKFNQDIDTYFLYLELLKIDKVDNPFINKYCKSINNTLNEKNSTIMLKRLDKIKLDWTEDYSSKLNRAVKNKIKFQEINGCENIARALETSVMRHNANHDKSSRKNYTIIKSMYSDCLEASIKKKLK
jgi:hypothetical protein